LIAQLLDASSLLRMITRL